jgi:hypothetical protein
MSLLGDRTTRTRWNAKWQPIVALSPGASPHLSSVGRFDAASALQR